MQKFFLITAASIIFIQGVYAYTYQWNVPYDNYGTIRGGGMYYGGGNAIVKRSSTINGSEAIYQESIKSKNRSHRNKLYVYLKDGESEHSANYGKHHKVKK